MAQLSDSANKPIENKTNILTSAKKEQRNFTWKIENFRQCLGTSKYKKTLTIAELSFTVVLKIHKMNKIS